MPFPQDIFRMISYYSTFLPAALALFLMSGCDSNSPETDSLSGYVATSALPVSDQLISCAGGGANDLVTHPEAPVSIYYYPVAGAGAFRYYETEDISQDPDNLELYDRVILDDAPFFNGYLRRFRNIPIQREKWARVTFETADSLHVSNAIRLKYPVLPTTYDSSKVAVELNGVHPTFSWPDHNNSLDVIYFQVVSDRNGNLISGTYTFDKTFTFYDLSNVVLNIRDVSPAPSLDIGEPYKFTLMTVSSDNWVNLISERNFIVE